ncbi:hypothetical protein GCM10008929_01580 [Alkalibacterium psychrotolerans]
MPKRLVVLSTLLLSLGLSACQGDTEETMTEDEVNETAVLDTASADSAEDDELSDDSEAELAEEAETNEESDYDKNEALEELLTRAEKEYEAEHFDAAAGTLSKLFQYDLSDASDLAEKAENLQASIQSVQASNASSTNQESAYKEERQSAILAEEYLTATGQSIETASDEDLSAWLSEKEAEKDAENSERDWTKEEAENYAFDQLILLEELSYENYFFFVNMTTDDWVQLEAREAVEQDGVTWSNLIGLYRYNVSTDELQKLDAVTGEYETIINPS